MLAMSVMAMVGIAIWTATSQTSRTRAIVDESHDQYHQIRIAFAHLTRDLSSAFLSNHRAANEPTHNPVFIGQNSGDDDRLDFTAFTHERRYLDVKESDQCEVGYYLDDDKDIRGRKNLVRRKSPHLDLESLSGGQHLVLVQNVAAFDLSYFDFAMNEWQDKWDTSELTSESGFLPHQVRIRLVVYDRREEKMAYGTQIAIPMRTPIWRKYGFLPGPPPPVTK
jgi:general secretion pathway protein J